MRQTTQKISLRPIALALALAFSSGAVMADKSWTGTTDSDWNTNTNWEDSSAPGTSEKVTIDGTGGADKQPVINSTEEEVGSVEIESAGTNDALLTVKGDGGSLDVNGNVNVMGSNETAAKSSTLTISDDGAVIIDGILKITGGAYGADSKALVEVIKGALTVKDVDNKGFGIVVTGGVADNGDAKGTAALQVGENGVLNVTGGIKLLGATAEFDGEVDTGGNVEVLGDNKAAATLEIGKNASGADVSVGGDLIVKAGSNAIETAKVDVDKGLLAVTGAINLDGSGGTAVANTDLTVGVAGTVTANGLSLKSATGTVNGKLNVGAGGVTLEGASGKVATLTADTTSIVSIAGDVTLKDYGSLVIKSSDAEDEGDPDFIISEGKKIVGEGTNKKPTQWSTLEFVQTSEKTKTLENDITGNLNLKTSGSGGETVLTGATTYTGTTEIGSGTTLKLENDGDLSSSVATIAGILNLEGIRPASVEGEGAAPATGTAKIKLAATSHAGSVITGDTENLVVELTGAATTFTTGTLGGNAGAFDEDDTSRTTLTVKNGSDVAATLTLKGEQTYIGTTTVEVTKKAITLALDTGGSIEHSSELILDGSSKNAKAVFDIHEVTSSATIQGLTGNEYSEVVTDTDSALEIDTAEEKEFVFAGAITGAGNLAKDGKGTQTLSGANTYSGSTNINGGTLIIKGTLDEITTDKVYVYTKTIGIAEDASLVFDQSANQEISGVISGDGRLVKKGEGILTLSNAGNGYTGGTTVSGGTLSIGKDDAEGNSNIGHPSEGVKNTLAGGTLLLTEEGSYDSDWTIANGTKNFIKVDKDVDEDGVTLAGNYQFESEGGKTTYLNFSGGKIEVEGFIRNYSGGVVEVEGGDTLLSLTGVEDEDYDFTGMTIKEDAALGLGTGTTLGIDNLTQEKGSEISGEDGAETNVEKTWTAYDEVFVNGSIPADGINPFTVTVASGGTIIPIVTDDYEQGKYVINLSGDVKVDFSKATFDLSNVPDSALDYLFNDLSKIVGLNTAYMQSGYLTQHTWAADGTRHAKATEQAKALSEGFLGGIGLLTLGGDLVTDQGLSSAASSVARSGGAGEAFAALGGGKVKHKTGSHVDVSGVSLVAGVAAGVGNGATVGAFVEYGDGDYDSSNSFARAGKVKGSGDAEYVGVGFLGRFDLPKTSSGQGYLEATARFGRVESDFKTYDLQNAQGQRSRNRVEYDVKSNYHGLSLGGGHVWAVGKDSAVDLYGRYVWTRQAGDSANIVSSSPRSESVKFSAVDSHRVRAGVRYSTAWSGSNRFYAGAAWEHEFDGEASARVVGAGKIKSPEMKGSTGIAEFGLVFTPADDKNLSIDLGIQAYGGKRSGATGSAQLKYAF